MTYHITSQHVTSQKQLFKFRILSTLSLSDRPPGSILSSLLIFYREFVWLNSRPGFLAMPTEGCSLSYPQSCISKSF
jgi:hypothetical protein